MPQYQLLVSILVLEAAEWGNRTKAGPGGKPGPGPWLLALQSRVFLTLGPERIALQLQWLWGVAEYSAGFRHTHTHSNLLPLLGCVLAFYTLQMPRSNLQSF